MPDLHERHPEIRRATWTSKGCDVCGEATRIEGLGERRLVVPASKLDFEFLYSDALCLECGFVFSAKIPPATFLTEYYASAYSLADGLPDVPLDYDSGVRLEVLRRHLAPPARVLELGAASGEFCEVLEREGYVADGVDPMDVGQNQKVEQAFVADCAPALAGPCDAVVSYYVLEHVTDANRFVRVASDLLVPRGLLILEVPDFERQPSISLFHEHFLHFTEGHLARLLSREGFEVLEHGPTLASRAFGFGIVARKGSGQVELSEGGAVQRGRLLYRRGVSERQVARMRLQNLVGEVLPHVEAGASVFLWGANEIALELGGLLVGAGIDPHFVDNSPRKWGRRLPGFRHPVCPPEFGDNPAGSVFLICSLQWSQDIRRQIQAMRLANCTILEAG